MKNKDKGMRKGLDRRSMVSNGTISDSVIVTGDDAIVLK